MPKLKSIILCSALAVAGLAHAGSITAVFSGGSASVLLNGNGINDGFVFSPTISADTSNYNVKSAAQAAGWDGSVKLTASITINSGVVVSANSTGAYAFDTGTGFPAGSTITLANNGYILGMGGAGGAYQVSGSSGGPALRAQYAITVTNTGTVGGGGGGGEGCVGGGGGGRTGRTNSAGGPGYSGVGGSLPGGQGTFSAAGAGGVDSVLNSHGAAGGTFGAAGGRSSCNYGLVGAGGAAVVGNSNIIWSAAGTRLGALN